MDSSYVPKDGDIVACRIFPSSSDYDNSGWGTAINVLGWIFTPVTSIVSGIATGKWNGVYDGMMKTLYDSLGLDKESATDETKKIPSISGAKNKTQYGEPIPLVLGKSLFTPRWVGSPYRTISGTYGEDEYYNILLMCGYNKLNVTDIRFAEFPVATNKDENGNCKITNGFVEVDTEDTWISSYSKTLDKSIVAGKIYYTKSGDTYTKVTSPTESQLANYYESDVQIELCEGTSSVLYPQKVVEKRESTELLKVEDTSLQVVRATAKNPQKIEVQIFFPNLLEKDSEGNNKETEVKLKLEMSYDMGKTWIPFNNTGFGTIGSEVTYNESSNECRFYMKRNEEMRFVATREFTSASEIWNNDGTCKFTNGQIYVRIQRTTPNSIESNVADKVYLQSVRTYCYDPKVKTEPRNLSPLDTKRTSLTTRVALRIKATKDLNKVLDEINMIEQSVAKCWNGTDFVEEKATSNPSALAVMVMQNEMLGTKNSVPMSRIDKEAFGDLYEYCEETVEEGINRYQCNGVLTQKKKLLDVINAVLNTARSFMVIKGDKYSVFVDRLLENPIPVTILNNHNILKDGLSNSKSFEDYPDAIRVKFIDETNGYIEQERIVKITDKDEGDSDYVIKDADEVFVTHPSQIYRLARFDYNKLITRPEIIQRKVSTEGNLIEVGSFVTIQDDTLSIGVGDGGEIKNLIIREGKIAGFEVDTYLDIEDSSKSYGVQISHYGDTHTVSSYRLSISQNGIHKELLLDVPLEIGSISVGDTCSFGLIEKISTDFICIEKQENGDGTFNLTFYQYDERTFDIETVPTFESNVTGNFNTTDNETPAKGDPIVTFDQLYNVKKELEDETDSKIASATFEASPTYKAIFNTSVIKKDNTGSYTPSVIVANGYENKGLTEQNPFVGNWHIFINDSQTEYDVITGSSINLNIADILESGIDNIDTIKIEFRSNDDSLLIQQELIPILTGASAYSVKLSTPSIVLEGDENKNVTETIVKTKAEVYYGLKEMTYRASDGWEYGVIETPEGTELSVDVTTGEITIKILAGSSLSDLGSLKIPVFIHSQTSTQIALGYVAESRATKMYVIGYNNVTIGYLQPDENGYYNTYFTWQKLTQNAVRLASLTQTVSRYWGTLTNDLVVTVAEKNTLQRLFDSLSADYEKYGQYYGKCNGFGALTTAYNSLSPAVSYVINTSSDEYGNYRFENDGKKNEFNQLFENYYKAKADLDSEIASVETNYSGITKTQDIAGLKPKINDYFVWGGANELQYGSITLYTGLVYKWNGSSWEEDKSPAHIMATMSEAFTIVEGLESDKIPAVTFTKRLMAMTVITKELYSKFASIEDLIAGKVVIGGYQKVKDGEVQQFITESDVDNTITQKGYQTADDVSDSVKQGVKTVTDNIYTEDTTEIDGGKITTNSVKADKIDVNDLMSKKLKLQNGGDIESETLQGAYSYTADFQSSYPIEVGQYFEKDNEYFLVISSNKCVKAYSEPAILYSIGYPTPTSAITHKEDYIITEDGRALKIPVGSCYRVVGRYGSVFFVANAGRNNWIQTAFYGLTTVPVNITNIYDMYVKSLTKGFFIDSDGRIVTGSDSSIGGTVSANGFENKFSKGDFELFTLGSPNKRALNESEIDISRKFYGSGSVKTIISWEGEYVSSVFYNYITRIQLVLIRNGVESVVYTKNVPTPVQGGGIEKGSETISLDVEFADEIKLVYEYAEMRMDRPAVWDTVVPYIQFCVSQRNEFLMIVNDLRKEKIK